MDIAKKFLPIGFVAAAGFAASELVTKDRSALVRVVGGGVGAALALWGAQRAGIIKVG